MRRAKSNPDATPGFAIEIKPDTDLGLAMLIAELAGGTYQPIAVVVSINEAREIADSNMAGRMRALEAGQEPACPLGYAVWAIGLDGDYRVAERISIS